jgi:hypothetical protein
MKTMPRRTLREEMTSVVAANRGSASVAGIGGTPSDPPVKKPKKLRDILKRRLPGDATA